MAEIQRFVDSVKWKKDLNDYGYIQCHEKGCQMAFLSMKGMEVHVRNCNGHVNDGDFVACPLCGVRFKTFLIMERHKDKTHKAEKIIQTKIVTPKRQSDVPDLFVNDSISANKPETGIELRNRILAESRRISTVRPPGRPPKNPKMPRTPEIHRIAR